MESVVSTDTQQLEALLRKVGAWQTGHFMLASGMHSSEYIQCQKLLQYPRYGYIFAQAMAAELGGHGLSVKTVVGPALGAVHWEVLVAHALDAKQTAESKSKEVPEPVRGLFAERPDGKFEIRRGLQIDPGEDVFVVEDVTTTGGSVREVVDLVKTLGGNPVAVGAIIDRSGGAAKFDVPFLSLIKLNLATYQADDCPLCQQGQPLVKPGSKKK